MSTPKLVTFIGTEVDKHTPRQFLHLADWPVKETRRITDDFALSEGFKTAANLAKELESKFPGFFHIEDEKPAPTTDTPDEPVKKGK